MPADAPLWRPGQGVLPRVRLRRQYRDSLDRPMAGEVTITGGRRAAVGEAVLVPAAVIAPVEDGVLDVYLPAGNYTLVATLRTVDGSRATDTHTVVLEEV